MNFNDLQRDWNSPRNNLPAGQPHVVAERFAHQMTRRRRFQRFWLAHTFVWLTAITGWVAVSMATGRTNPTEEWGLVPLLLVLWGAGLFMLRFRTTAARAAHLALPIREALSAALISNQTAQAQSRFVGALYVLLTPFLALVLHQLHAAGKVSPRELTSMAVFSGASLLVCGALLAARHFGRLIPQRRQLEGLLQEFNQAAG